MRKSVSIDRGYQSLSIDSGKAPSLECEHGKEHAQHGGRDTADHLQAGLVSVPARDTDRGRQWAIIPLRNGQSRLDPRGGRPAGQCARASVGRSEYLPYSESMQQ
jgi:hypothetical protein